MSLFYLLASSLRAYARKNHATVEIHFHFHVRAHVNFRRVKIEEMYRRSRVNVKVEPWIIESLFIIHG